MWMQTDQQHDTKYANYLNVSPINLGSQFCHKGGWSGKHTNQQYWSRVSVLVRESCIVSVFWWGDGGMQIRRQWMFTTTSLPSLCQCCIGRGHEESSQCKSTDYTKGETSHHFFRSTKQPRWIEDKGRNTAQTRQTKNSKQSHRFLIYCLIKGT